MLERENNSCYIHLIQTVDEKIHRNPEEHLQNRGTSQENPLYVGDYCDLPHRFFYRSARSRSFPAGCIAATNQRWAVGSVKHVLRRCVLQCIYLRIGDYAIYLRVHHCAIVRNGSLQAPAYLTNVVNQLPATAFIPFNGTHPGAFFWVSSCIILTAGTLFVMWLGEKITDKGIGNGISLIIMIGIIARLPFALFGEFVSRLEQQGGGLVMFLVELVVLIAVILLCILLVQGTRRIPVQYAKRIVGNKQYGGVRQYLPLKVNAAGVMPIIFAQAIMFIPVTIAGFASPDAINSGFWRSMMDFNGFWYNFIFALLIIVFTYFYTAITMNSQQIADDLKRNNGFIPGIKPGKKTMEFIDDVISRITLPGSIFLAIVAILPAVVSLFGVSAQFAQFYGGTSLLIMVGVILDTLQQIESHLLMRHYDGLTKSGRIKGRSGGAYGIA